MKIFRAILIASTLLASLAASAQTTGEEKRELRLHLAASAPLAHIIDELTVRADASLPWSLGAAPNNGIYWMTNGVVNCDRNQPCRQGYARVSVDGKELHNLGRAVEPVYWSIRLTSDQPERFGPRQADIHPVCDGVCSFDIQRDLSNGGYGVRSICRFSPSGPPSTTGNGAELYALIKNSNTTYLTYREIASSNGISGWLTLLLPQPRGKPDIRQICSRLAS